jgi:diacylglycerol kinase
MSLFLKITFTEWFIILLCIALVVSFEILNSALERLCDFVEDDFHPIIKTIKDMSAAAVLWTSLASAIIGLLIFLPKITHLLSTI